MNKIKKDGTLDRRFKCNRLVEAAVKGEASGIVDKQDRMKLSEGRSHGMGFAFLKPVDGHFETVQPISPCKDYLNDVVYSEHTGKKCVAYGLSYNKQGIFETGRAYLAMKICPFKGSEYPNYQSDIQSLKDNHKNIQSLLNHYEEKMGIEKTEISEVGDNLYLISSPLFWAQYTYLISIYTLVIRMALGFKGGDAEEYINNYKGEDVYLFGGIKTKWAQILAGEAPPQDLNALSGGYDVHNNGIKIFPFPIKVPV